MRCLILGNELANIRCYLSFQSISVSFSKLVRKLCSVAKKKIPHVQAA